MTSSANYWNQSRYIFEATGTSLDEDVTRPVGPYQGNGAWQGPTTYTFSKPAGSYTCGGYAIGTSPQNNPSCNAYTGWNNITAP